MRIITKKKKKKSKSSSSSDSGSEKHHQPVPEPEPVQPPPEPQHVYVPEPEPQPVYVPEPEPQPVYVPEPEPQPVYVPEPEPVPLPEPTEVHVDIEIEKKHKKEKKHHHKKSKSSSSSSSSSDKERKKHHHHQPEIIQQVYEPEPEPEAEVLPLPKFHTVTHPEMEEVSLAGVSVQFDNAKDDFAFEFPTAPTPQTEWVPDENFSLEVPTRPATIPVYRYHNPGSHDHFYTQKAEEIGVTNNGAHGNHGYISEGVSFYLAETEVDGYTPVYRFWNAGSKDHFYTANDSEKNSVQGIGYAFEGVVGYISTTQVEGTTPLYRYYNAQSKDHFYTSNAFEIGTTDVGATGQHGYQCEGIVGYAYTDSQ